MIGNFDQLLEQSLRVKGKKVVVISPSNHETMAAVVQAHEMHLAEFVLVVEEKDGKLNMPEEGSKLRGVEVVAKPDMTSVLESSVSFIRSGYAHVLMKGGVDTSTMMRAVLKEDSGLRTGRLLSDVFVFEYPARQENKFIMITDGGVTLAPDLRNKVELIYNAVAVAHALGNMMPKVAVLSASEFINPNLPSTLDAAALAKMNERGQIKGCVVDGPFALDNAISADAAGEKRIASPVAGKAEILIAPSIEAANSLAKSTTFFAGYRLAHVIVGGKVPILIPSRADKSDAKLLSIALGVLMAAHDAEKRRS